MHGAGDQLLARARLAGDENGRLAAGDPLDVGEHAAQSGTLAHDLVEAVERLDLRAEILGLVHEVPDALFRLQAFVDVPENERVERPPAEHES